MDKLQNNILDIAHNEYKYIMSLKNVKGLGLGYKRINGITTAEPCIHVLVEHKIKDKYLAQNGIVPKYYMGIKTDIIEVGNPKRLSRNVISQKFRPLEGGSGISIGYLDLAGTLGCIVFKKKLLNKEYFILSNNHVLANSNKGIIGSYIIQPNKTDGGRVPEDTIASLTTFTPIKFMEDISDIENAPINYVDCAIAKIIKKEFISSKIIDIGKIKGISQAFLGLKVKKVGIATGMTKGEVMTIGATTTTDFDNGKYALFQDSIMVDLKVEEGDSGSVLINNDNEIVGLLFSGTSLLGGIAYANNIENVLNSLKVKMYTN